MIHVLLLLGSLLAPVLQAQEFLPTRHGEAEWQPARDSLDSHWISLGGDWQWSMPGKGAGTCQIPSCWEEPAGQILFSRSFPLPEEGYQSRYRIEFCGVSHSCRIMVNGQFLDSHEGASASFSIDLPDRLLNYGSSNLLEVLVDSRLSARQTLPLKTQSWDPQNYGGIYREVFLVEESRQSIELYGWELNPADSRGRPGLRLELESSNRELVRIGEDSLKTGSPFTVRATVLDDRQRELASKAQEIRLEKLETRRFELEFPLAKETPLWSPASPTRCQLILELERDGKVQMRRRIWLGLRRLELNEGRLLINELQTPIRGITYTADHPDYGVALPPRILKEDLERIRNLGLNTILHLRGAPHPYFMEVCDQLGLMVIEELPVWKFPPSLLQAEAFLQVAGNQVREFARRDRIRASLLAISLGSGLDFSDSHVHDFLARMAELDVQPVLLAAGGFFANDVADDLDRDALAVLDALLLEPLGKEELPHLPDLDMLRILSRVGWPVEVGNQAGYENPYSELAQAHRLQGFLARYRRLELSGEVDGMVLHSFVDWRGGRPLLTSPPGQDSRTCSFGLLSKERVERSAAKELSSFNSGSAPATLARGEFSPTHPPAYPLAGFGLLILLLIGYKQNNVFAQNLRRSFVHSHGFFVDIRDKRIYQFGQSLFIWLLASGALSLLLSGWLHMLRKSPFFDRLLGLVLVVNPAKEWVISLAWIPLVSMAQICLGIMGAFLLTALGLRVLGLLFNARFTFRQAMTFLSWSAASLLFLIPVGIVLHPLLAGGLTRTLSLLLIGLILLWFFQRVFKAMRIAFGSSFWSMFSLVSVIMIGLVILILVWYENAHSVFEYLEFYRRIYWRA